MVFETRKGPEGADYWKLTADGQSVYFLEGDLWHSNGTAKGSVRLTRPEATGVSGLESSPGLVPPMVGVGETVFFRANDGRSGSELWMSSGRKTRIVQDLRPGFDSSNPQNLTRLGKRALFSASGTNGRLQVWSTDGKPRGTFPVTDFPSTGWGAEPGGFVAGDNLCFFTSGGFTGNALWVTDGSGRNGTREIRRPEGGSFIVRAQSPTLIGSLFYFADYNPSNGISVWRSDGMSGGLRRLIGPSPDVSYSHFVPAGGGACFFADGSKLWASDGTETGTHQVAVTPNFWGLEGTALLDHRFLFVATAENHNKRLWISDGTAEGTRILLDAAFGELFYSARLGNEMVFAIDDHVHGRELWRTDGTPEGTTLLKDIWPGEESGNPMELISAGGRVYFAADDGVHGRELWCTDGTSEGTFLTGETMTGEKLGVPLASNPSALTVVGSRLFFGAQDPVAGHELHSLDLKTVAPPALVTIRQVRSIAPRTAQPADEAALLRRAFHLPPEQPGTPGLFAGDGTAGFPEFVTSNGHFRVTYLRLKDGSLSYLPKWSASLAPGSFQPMTGPETVTPIDAEWERVTASEPIPAGTLRMFGIVEITENP